MNLECERKQKKKYPKWKMAVEIDLNSIKTK